MSAAGRTRPLRDRGFVAAVATLLGGKSAAALISLALTPVIARLFLPADFGVFAIIAALVMPLVVLATLRLDLAVVIPPAEEEAIGIFSAASSWLWTFSAVLLLIGGAASAAGWPLPFAGRLGAWIWVVPFAVAIQGLSTLCTGWLVRDKQFAVLATSEISRAATTPGTRLALGLTSGSTVWGLAAGYFAGLAIQLFQLWRRLPQHVTEVIFAGSLTRQLRTISRWRDFPMFNTPTGLLLAGTQSLPVIAMGAIYTPAVAGLYAMAVRLIGSPGNILATSVRRVYMQRIAGILDDRARLRAAWFKTTGVLVLLGLLPFLALWQYGRELLSVFLGARWAEAGVYAELLAVLLFTQWVTVPSSSTLVVARRQHWLLIIEIFVFAGQLGVLLTATGRQAAAVSTVGSLVLLRVLADAVTFTIGAVMVWRGPRGS